MPISIDQSNALDAYYFDRMRELEYRVRVETRTIIESRYNDRTSELTACGEDAADELHRISLERDTIEMLETYETHTRTEVATA